MLILFYNEHRDIFKEILHFYYFVFYLYTSRFYFYILQVFIDETLHFYYMYFVLNKILFLPLLHFTGFHFVIYLLVYICLFMRMQYTLFFQVVEGCSQRCFLEEMNLNLFQTFVVYIDSFESYIRIYIFVDFYILLLNLYQIKYLFDLMYLLFFKTLAYLLSPCQRSCEGI